MNRVKQIEDLLTHWDAETLRILNVTAPFVNEMSPPDLKDFCFEYVSRFMEEVSQYEDQALEAEKLLYLGTLGLVRSQLGLGDLDEDGLPENLEFGLKLLYQATGNLETSRNLFGERVMELDEVEIFRSQSQEFSAYNFFLVANIDLLNAYTVISGHEDDFIKRKKVAKNSYALGFQCLDLGLTIDQRIGVLFTLVRSSKILNLEEEARHFYVIGMELLGEVEQVAEWVIPHYQEARYLMENPD